MERLNSKLDVKRAIMVFVPGVPPPLIDYALSTPFLKSMVNNKSDDKDDEEIPEKKSNFGLKRMDSGEWGERSLASPIQQKYPTGSTFGEASKLRFQLDG